MTETTIYIQKELTPEVIKGLKTGKHYFLIDKEGREDFMEFVHTEYGYHFEIENDYTTYEYSTEDFSFIVLPVTVNTDMVEKENKKYANRAAGDDYRLGRIEGFDYAINWLLSLTNKEENK